MHLLFMVTKMKGDIFGDWTKTGVVIRKPLSSGRMMIYDECICVCGIKKPIQRYHLNSGASRNCGCANIERVRKLGLSTKIHGMEGTVVYRKFGSLKTRCANPKATSYHNYGGRGIKCLWIDFKSFRDDMGESYLAHCKIHGADKTTIDRIDVNGHYCKENCKWATWKEQQNNRRNNVRLIYNGKNQTVTQRERQLGVKVGFIRDRLKYGRSIKDAIEIPNLGFGNNLREYKKKERKKLINKQALKSKNHDNRSKRQDEEP